MEAITLDDFETLARERLPHTTYEFIASGAADEVTAAGAHRHHLDRHERSRLRSPIATPNSSGAGGLSAPDASRWRDRRRAGIGAGGSDFRDEHRSELLHRRRRCDGRETVATDLSTERPRGDQRSCAARRSRRSASVLPHGRHSGPGHTHAPGARGSLSRPTSRRRILTPRGGID